MNRSACTGVDTEGVGINMTAACGAECSYGIYHEASLDCTEVGIPSAVGVTLGGWTIVKWACVDITDVASVKSEEVGVYSNAGEDITESDT